MTTDTVRTSDRFKAIVQKHYPATVLAVGVLLFILFNVPFQYVAIMAALFCIGVCASRRRKRSPSYVRYQLIAGVAVLVLMVFYEDSAPWGGVIRIGEPSGS